MMFELVVGLSSSPRKFGFTNDLQPSRMDQVEVADEVGGPHPIVMNGDVRIEAPGNVAQTQGGPIGLKQLGDAGSPHAGSTRQKGCAGHARHQQR